MLSLFTKNEINRIYSINTYCRKFSERLIHNNIFKCYIDNDLISLNQSWFNPWGSCSRTTNITYFEKGHKVRGVFLYISKSFDKVWHESPLFKLRENGIAGDRLNIIRDFLNTRQQRVVLNSQNPPLEYIKVGVLQGSIFDPLSILTTWPIF